LKNNVNVPVVEYPWTVSCWTSLTPEPAGLMVAQSCAFQYWAFPSGTSALGVRARRSVRLLHRYPLAEHLRS
jgi:hypothetical protein